MHTYNKNKGGRDNEMQVRQIRAPHQEEEALKERKNKTPETRGRSVIFKIKQALAWCCSPDTRRHYTTLQRYMAKSTSKNQVQNNLKEFQGNLKRCNVTLKIDKFRDHRRKQDNCKM